jgi:hypothetical protein
MLAIYCLAFLEETATSKLLESKPSAILQKMTGLIAGPDFGNGYSNSCRELLFELVVDKHCLNSS